MTATQWLAQLMTPSTTSAGYYRFYLLSTSNCCLLVLIIVLGLEKYFISFTSTTYILFWDQVILDGDFNDVTLV